MPAITEAMVTLAFNTLYVNEDDVWSAMVIVVTDDATEKPNSGPAEQADNREGGL